jgi:hypothetical protein
MQGGRDLAGRAYLADRLTEFEVALAHHDRTHCGLLPAATVTKFARLHGICPSSGCMPETHSQQTPLLKHLFASPHVALPTQAHTHTMHPSPLHQYPPSSRERALPYPPRRHPPLVHRCRAPAPRS